MTLSGEQPIAIGVDVGGTAIKAGIVSSTGQLLQKREISTEAANGPEHVLARIATMIAQLRESAPDRCVQGVGIGVPGTIDRPRGEVIAPPNLPGWQKVPVVAQLSKSSGLRVVLNNDAKNAAWGEYVCGAGRGVRDMVMLTLGTGIGGGLIFDGQLWRGVNDNAGEIGHSIVVIGGRRCGCGQLGCLEAYASATNAAARATEAIAAGEPSILKAILDRGERINAEHIVAADDRGDPLAKRIWQETCRFLAVACINLQHTLNPERIVLSGGMSKAGEHLRAPIVHAIDELNSRMLGNPPAVRLATLGNDAGFIGAALSVFTNDRHDQSRV